MRNASGLTLIEALVVMSIAAILAVAGASFTRNFLLDSRMTSAVNALVHAVHLARQEANRDLRDVVICRSLDALQCAPAGNWISGWIVFINADRDDPPVVDLGEIVLQVNQSPALRSITSNRRAYVLRPYPLRAVNGTVVFCDERGAADARGVIVSYTGRPRLASRNASNQPLICP